MSATLAAVALLPACASSPGDAPGAAGSHAGAGTSGSGSVGGSSAGQTAVAGGAGSAGTSSAGAGSLGGAAPSGGSAGAGGTTATAGSGGAGGTSTTPGLGASGKAVCQGLSGFTDPTMGVGTVSEVTAPDTKFFAFIEGPVWVASQKKLFFSDNAGSPERIWTYDLTAPPTIFQEDTGSNGMGVDAQDKLLVADQKNHGIYRLDPATGMKIGAAIVSGSYKPNDVVGRSDGALYFTDPDTGFYYVVPGGSDAKVVNVSGARPNGIVLTLDESALIVGDVGNQKLTRFALAADGSVMMPGADFAMTTGTTADGMCMDCGGNVYVSTQTGVEVFDPTGKRLGVVPTGESSNCTFGGPDRKTLFVTSRALLKYVKLANPGLPD